MVPLTDDEYEAKTALMRAILAEIKENEKRNEQLRREYEILSRQFWTHTDPALD